MLLHLRRWFVPAVAITVAATAALRAQNAQENAADAERLIRALAVQPGQTIGEIGAGGGELTIALARVVGESGRVLSNDINKETLRKIGVAIGEAGVTNVTLVEGREKDTNFPASCCDAIFMRAVYHHFGDPASMNASILQSLKPGGRLAIIDFTPPPGGENPPGGRALDNHHGVTSPTVERELKAAGFEIISTETEQRMIMVVARRPLTPEVMYGGHGVIHSEAPQSARTTNPIVFSPASVASE
jgi:ubiquinone/menaquinone biosynthesis C-methylase UbiE